MQSSQDHVDLRVPDPEAHDGSPRPWRVGLLATTLLIVASLVLAGFRYIPVLARPLAVGACTNPYTVEQGDWLYKIAQVCGVDPAELLAANALADPNQIWPGQQLVLPGAAPAVIPDVPNGEAASVQAAPVVDAAAQSAPAPIEAAAQQSASSVSTLVVGPVADAFINGEHPSAAYGRSIILRTSWGVETSYLTFDIALPEGTSVASASLRVFVHGSSPVGFAVHAASSADWDEYGLTYASAPPVGAMLGTSGPHGGWRSVEVNLAGYIAGSGRYSLVLVPLGEKPVAYYSREAGTGAPAVVLQLAAGTPPPLPTGVPTVEPTAVPTVEPTAVPTVAPTAVPTVAPTAVPPVDPTATPPPAPIGNPLDCDVTNIAWSVPGQLLRGGRPDADDLACLAAAGVDVVVDQRAPSEVDYDEAGAARAVGIEYINLGIPDDTAPSPATLRAWIDTVNGRLAEGKVILVHDRAGRGRMGFWDAVFAMLRGASARQAVEDHYIARAFPFDGAKIGCGDGGNGQVQALAEIGAILTGAAYTPSVDEYGTPWLNCARPAYMADWDYASVLP